MDQNNSPTIFSSRDKVPPQARIVDAFTSTKSELFFIDHPQLKHGTPEGDAACAAYLKEHDIQDAWIYYPWRNVAVHTISESDYFRLRTARNRNIITAEEQTKYRACILGVIGLSVGSGVLEALTMSGGPKCLRIGDFDTLEISNLNRLRATLADVGENKAVVAARRVWDLDPWAEIDAWPKGVTKDTLQEFIVRPPALTVLIDEMDSIDLKIRVRLIARAHRIPVLMATDNGDGVIIDVERFDEEPAREIFHGSLGNLDPTSLEKLTFREWLAIATKVVGPEYLTERMQESLLEIGKTVAAVPQLGPTASIAGAALAFATRRIANGLEMPSGRYAFGLEGVLIPHYNDPEEVARRAQQTEAFKKNFGSRA